MEIIADQIDFQLANGNQLKTGDTVGEAKIIILPAPPAGTKSATQHPGNSTTGDGSELNHGRDCGQASMPLSRSKPDAGPARRRPTRESSPPRPASPKRSARPIISMLHSLPMAAYRSWCSPETSAYHEASRQPGHRRPCRLRRRRHLHSRRPDAGLEWLTARHRRRITTTAEVCASIARPATPLPTTT